MRSGSLSFALAGALLVTAGQALAQDSRNAISVGGGVHPLGSVAPVVTYEYLLNNRFSIGGRYVKLKYTYDDGAYHETGDGGGPEVIAHIYFHDHGFKGPYLAVAAGRFSVDWEWSDPTTTAPRSGSGKTSGLEASAAFGWKVPLGTNLFLDPSITVGDFFGTAKDSTGKKESQLGFYGAALIRLGVSF